MIYCEANSELVEILQRIILFIFYLFVLIFEWCYNHPFWALGILAAVILLEVISWIDYRRAKIMQLEKTNAKLAKAVEQLSKPKQQEKN